MIFAVYLPPQAVEGPVPVLWFLSGLTCTHENAMTKAGAQAWAADAFKIMLMTGKKRAAAGFYKAVGFNAEDKTAMVIRRPDT